MKMTNSDQRQMIVAFYAAYKIKLISLATTRLGSREEGEDLVQDVFVKLIDCEKVVSETSLKSFAYTIANNMIVDKLRRRVFRHNMEEYVKYEMQPQYCGAERVAEYHELLHLVYHSLEQMNASCARICRMSLLEEKTAGEIADELQVSKRTVECQLYSSRKKMRAILKVV